MSSNQTCLNLIKLDQIGSKRINVVEINQIGLNRSIWFKLNQIALNLIQINKTCSNMFKLDQTCSKLIKMNQFDSNGLIKVIKLVPNFFALANKWQFTFSICLYVYIL